MTRNFMLLGPIILLIAAGVFATTSRKTAPQIACSTNDYSGVFSVDEALAYFENSQIEVPKAPQEGNLANAVLGAANPQEKWIEVDLSEQKLTAWEGNAMFLETLVSSGLPHWATPTGEFRIWTKLRATKMEGGVGRYYYNLPNVPYVMFFANKDIPSWRGYGLHGTYWHNEFGTQRSHGCVNLPTHIAEQLYYWTTPVLPSGKYSVFASNDNPGTRIVIHE